MLHRLRHLGLHIQEWTVSSADIRYAPVAVDPAYRAFHHLLHVRRFLALVKAAENLRFLTISCTDMSPIVETFPIPESWRLRHLSLRRAEFFSSEKLEEVVGMSRDSLESLELREVELRSGTWQQVLESLSEAPRLSGFRMESSMRTGPRRGSARSVRRRIVMRTGTP
ncbi:hypothetical protein PG984_005517 [Apiospora sp. TS-2023a]